MHKRFLPLLLALALAAGGAMPSPSASAGDAATLSEPLQAWVATAADTSTFKTIVTFDSYAGMSRIDTLGVGATTLNQLPVAFATLTADQVRQVASWPETRSLWHDQR